MEYRFGDYAILRYKGGMQAEVVFADGASFTIPVVARFIEPRGTTILVLDGFNDTVLASLIGIEVRGGRVAVVWYEDYMYIIDHRRHK